MRGHCQRPASIERLEILELQPVRLLQSEQAERPLALGATDYFAKPSGTGGLDASLRVLREELIPEIKALCRRSEAPGYP